MFEELLAIVGRFIEENHLAHNLLHLGHKAFEAWLEQSGPQHLWDWFCDNAETAWDAICSFFS